ncbi:hypothetical protein PZF70_000989 [Acinetobacter baumannii]|uniref:hypothetical protein n=1 Tax=Acinetobacter baumannii TaxID=470 RepID=UPI000A66FE57|nr:hypothetical protein [Acinetobacter baumannii]EKW9652143.1 hypothetical protein [Acinetobacter baumannii]MBK6067208.1 hypothetical protein [Acinetobacter baumannii]TDI43952.1 hypothetical protein DWA10_02955 [Acinetobacter baumannii]HAV3713339.1 hypothetical protein [Acinetobacter baumannii]HAV4279326.1 hypothetical protein [Acinetobacter baumannii]
MKPEQFIREFGVEKAREVVKGAPDGHKGYNGVINQYTRGVWFSRDVMLSDLNRLVESLDIIEFHEGISGAKLVYKLRPSDAEGVDLWVRLERAIKDHESIYGEEQ